MDDRAHHETFVNQCNVSPITGFVRHTKLKQKFCMPDEARDGRNVALIDKCFMVCSIVQRRIKLLFLVALVIRRCVNATEGTIETARSVEEGWREVKASVGCEAEG